MRRFAGVLLISVLALAGCGDAGFLELFLPEEPESTDRPTPTVTASPFNISEVEQSVVKIAGEGTFVDPESGEQRTAAGVGSGVIVSEDGLVVTNNHVVTGAGLLRVYVPGKTEPINAKIVGVSECSDLAVIQLGGGGYTPLGYRTDEVSTGLSVYAAGYPGTDARTLDEIDYTLTRGIVSSRTASGETPWASVDEVIEHDARIRGGNSGGPLVDESGKIVGINYAGNEQSDQNYAISAANALPIIEQLSSGENAETIGINGEAVQYPDIQVSGIWVSSVKSGSPADYAGLMPGDIIQRLEGIDMASDGTMNDSAT